MARRLYDFAHWMSRHAGRVAIVWLLVLIAIAALGISLKGTTSSAFTIPGTESQRAIDLLDAQFPGTGGADARIVVAAPVGHNLTETRYQPILKTALEELAKAPQVLSVTAPTPATQSKNKMIAYGDVHYAVPVADVSDAAKAALTAAVAPARAAGLGD